MGIVGFLSCSFREFWLFLMRLGGTMPVKLIAHVLLTVADSHLIIQRSQIKRSKPNVFPQYWDIPGGRVEENELPRDLCCSRML